MRLSRILDAVDADFSVRFVCFFRFEEFKIVLRVVEIVFVSLLFRQMLLLLIIEFITFDCSCCCSLSVSHFCSFACAADWIFLNCLACYLGRKDWLG